MENLTCPQRRSWGRPRHTILWCNTTLLGNFVLLFSLPFQLVFLPLSLGWFQSEFHRQTPPCQGGYKHGNPCMPAGRVCRDFRGGIGTALPRCVCTINTMFSVQTELECWQHAVANTVIVTQELDGSLLQGNRFVFLPSIHLMNKQLHRRFSTPPPQLNSLAET